MKKSRALDKKKLISVLNIKELKEAFNTVRMQKLNLSFPVLTDLVYLLLFGITLFFTNLKIDSYLNAIGTRLVESAGNVLGTRLSENFLNEILANDPAIKSLMIKFFFLLLFVMVVHYIIYTVLQSISWYLCCRISGRKTKLPNFMLRFSLGTLVFFIIFGIYSIGSLILQINEVLAMPGSQDSAGFTFSMIFFFIIIYFLAIFYSRIGFSQQKKGFNNLFIEGIKKFPKYLSFWILFFIVLIAVNKIGYMTGSNVFGFIFEVVILLPFLSFARILLFNISETSISKD